MFWNFLQEIIKLINSIQKKISKLKLKKMTMNLKKKNLRIISNFINKIYNLNR